MDKNILIDNGINVTEGIEILGDIDLYNETLQDFLDEVCDKLSKLEEYKNNKDMENYAIVVHALKGDSKYLGFTSLQELALEHQLKSEKNDYEYIQNHYNELIEESKRIIDVVKKYLNG